MREHLVSLVALALVVACKGPGAGLGPAARPGDPAPDSDSGPEPNGQSDPPPDPATVERAGVVHPPRTTPEGVDLNDRTQLEAASFSYWGQGTSEFEDGILTTTTDSYEEWGIKFEDHPRAAWWTGVDWERGWAVEARLRIVSPPSSPCYGGGPGLWIHDRRRLVKLYIRGGEAGVGFSGSPTMAKVDTATWHTYRLEGQGEWLRLLVDDAVLVEVDSRQTTRGQGTMSLTFGDLGGCSGSTVEWDFVGYDLSPPLVEPCVECSEGEHVELARLRRGWAELGPIVAHTDTDDLSTECLAYAIFDPLVRRTAAAALDDLSMPKTAKKLRRLPALGPDQLDRAYDAFADVNVEQGLLGACSRCQSGDPSAWLLARPHPPRHDIEPPPPRMAQWPEQVRIGLEALATGRPSHALRHARDAVLSMHAEGHAVADEARALLADAPAACARN